METKKQDAVVEARLVRENVGIEWCYLDNEKSILCPIQIQCIGNDRGRGSIGEMTLCVMILILLMEMTWM